MDHCQTTGAVEIKHTISFFISVHKMTYTSLSCTILRVLYVFCNIFQLPAYFNLNNLTLHLQSECEFRLMSNPQMVFSSAFNFFKDTV